MLPKLFFVLLLSLSMFIHAEPIRIEVLRGESIKQYAREFANLCHVVYGEYPYLYDGEDAGYEAYISGYGDSPNTIVSCAFDGNRLVGACSGMPLIESRDYYQAPFLAQNISIAPFFYISELIIFKEYRGKGIGESLYKQVETIVKNEGHYSQITCCNIQVSKNDPRRPQDYKSVEYPLWIKLGFKKYPEISYNGFWVNVGEKEESPHHLVFWVKDLKPQK